MKIIKNKDLIEYVKNYDVILIATSTKNALGNGFQHKVARNFPYVNTANKNTIYDDRRKLGTVNVIEGKPTFCLCYIHTGRYRPDKVPDVVDYESLEKCLNLINKNFKGKKIATTVMGHSGYEGGGDYNRCIEIMKRCLTDVILDVYDYEQINFRVEDNHRYKNIEEEWKDGKITLEEFRLKKKDFLWEKYFGIYEPKPDVPYRELKKVILEKKKTWK